LPASFDYNLLPNSHISFSLNTPSNKDFKVQYSVISDEPESPSSLCSIFLFEQLIDSEDNPFPNNEPVLKTIGAYEKILIQTISGFEVIR